MSDPPPLPFGGAPSSGAVWSHLFDRRTVMVGGPLDDAAVGLAAAELMTLDATGDDPVTVILDSPGGSLDAGFALIDTIAAMGVAVHAVCMGRAEGAAVGVFAAAERRLVAPHAMVHLIEPPAEASGPASTLARFAAHRQQRTERFAALLAAATGRPAEHVEADLAAGRWLGAEEAVAYGLAHAVWGPRPRRESRPPPGFRSGLGD